MKPTFRFLAVALLTLLQASAALSDAPLIWGPSNTARLLNSGELVGKNGDIYLHSPVALTFPAANAKGPLLNDGSGTLSWLVGNNNSFTGFDSTGTMVSVPGYSWDQTTSALNANLAVDPFVNSYTLYGFNTQANPTADTANAVTNAQFQNDCGTDDSGFACGNPTTGAGGLYGINNNLNSNHKSPAGHLQQYNGYSQIGNGVDPITVHDIGGIANGQTLASGVTLDYVNQIINNLQAPAGSKLNTYTGLADYSNINHLLQNYNGIQNSATIATIDGYYNGFQDSSQVTTANSSYTSYQVSPGIATLRGSYNGVNVSPNVVNGALTAEQFEITTVADVAQSLAGKYLTFCDPNTDGGTCWAPWFKVSGTGTAPVLSGYTLIEVDINTGDSASVVGTTLYTAVNALTVNLTWVDSGTGVVTGTAINAGGSQQAQAQTSGFAVVMLVFGGGDGQAVGVNISMNQATGFQAGSVKAIVATGDVDINGKLQTGSDAPMTDQGGTTANPVNTINTGFSIATGVTVNNADEFGFGPIANLTLGANAHLNASPGLQVGASSLGMIGLITMDNGSTATNVNGSFIAQVLVGGTGSGGVIDDMNAYRAVSANFGSPSTVTNSRAFFADDLLGAPATNKWGFYAKSSFENYMGKSLKIGGTAGVDDKVSNSSVGLEIDPTLALLPDPMTTTVRDSLTPLTGMLVNNSTTNQLERYDGAAWVAVGGVGLSTSVGGALTTASNIFSNGNSYLNDIVNPPLYVAQRFTATSTGNFASYETKMQNSNGPTGCVLQAELWSDNGLGGANSDIGSLLASSTTTLSDSTLLTSSLNNNATSSVPSSIYNFTGYPVVSGTMYWVVVRVISGSLGLNQIFALTNTGTTSPPARAPGNAGGYTATTYFNANVITPNQFVLSNANNYLDSSFLNYNVNFGGNVLSGVSTPLAPTDAANKAYVDSAGFTGTTGSVPFVGAGGSLTEDNSKFFWDDSQFFLGLGTNSPDHAITINSNQPASIKVNNSISSSFSEWAANVGGTEGRLVFTGPTFGDPDYGTNSLVIHAEDTNGDVRIYPGQTASHQTMFSHTGNVGIGNSAPVSRFAVSGNASIGTGYNATSAPANGMIVEGRVGIGTTTPTQPLEIVTAGSDGMRVVGSSSTNFATFEAVNDANHYFLATTSGSSVSTGFLDANQALLYTDAPNGLRLTTESTVPMEFRTNNTEAMRITGAQNVGIGTTAPLSKLSIANGASVGGSVPTGSGFTVSGTGANNRFVTADGDKTLNFQVTGASNFGELSSYDFGTSSAFPLYLNANGGNVGVGSLNAASSFAVTGNASVGSGYNAISAPANGMIVQGNVGIGTSSTAYLLDVGATGSKFQVDSSGNTVRIHDVPTVFPLTQGAANTFLTNDGSGNLSWASTASPANIATLSGGTTTLTLSSNKNQYYTLTAASTVKLPGSGVPAGYTFTFYTLGDFDLVVQSDDGTPITTANGAVLDATTRYGSVTLVANRVSPSVVTDWNVANVYERYNDTITTSGALSVSVVGAYTRNNHLVSIDWNTGSEYISGTAAGTNTVTWGNIPTRFRPAAIRTGQTLTLSTINQSGIVQLTSGGGFTIYKDLQFNPFTGAISARVYSFSMSWSI